MNTGGGLAEHNDCINRAGVVKNADDRAKAQSICKTTMSGPVSRDWPARLLGVTSQRPRVICNVRFYPTRANFTTAAFLKTPFEPDYPAGGGGTGKCPLMNAFNADAEAFRKPGLAIA